MFFVEAKTVGSISTTGYAPTKLQEIIDEFVLSNCDCVELIYGKGEYASPMSAYLSVRSAIQRSHYSIRVCKKQNRIFLHKN